MPELTATRPPQRKEGHKPPQKAAAQPVGLDVEKEARQKLEKEQSPENPQSASQLIQASQKAVHELQIKFARSEPDLQNRLIDFERIINRYLEIDNQPSEYSRVLVASINKEQVSQPDQRAVRELSTRLTADINHLLHQILSDIRQDKAIPDKLKQDFHTGADLTTPEGLQKAISSFEIASQRIKNIFSLLEGVSPEKIDLPREIVVEDPLHRSNLQYWKDRYWGERQFKKDISPFEMIAKRSGAAAGSLEMAADQISDIEKIIKKHEQGQDLTEQEEEVVREFNACQTLANWITTQTQLLKNSGTPEEFAYRKNKLDFIHGRADQIFDVFNAAEVIKKSNPELFARLLGVAPQYGSAEAKRSDLFGNVFQIAVARSQQLKLKKGDPGMQVLKQRIEKLTQLDQQQRLLLQLNEGQMKQLERLFQNGDDIEDKNMKTTMAMVIVAHLAGEYSLRKLLDTVAIEQREEFLTQIETGSPQEIIDAIRNLPDFMINDEEVLALVHDRFLMADEEQNKRGTPSLIFNLCRPFSSPKGKHYSPEMVVKAVQSGHASLDENARDVLDMRDAVQIKRLLWETAPAEKILSREFYNYLHKLAFRISNLERTARERPDQREGINDHIDFRIDHLVGILAGHPEINNREWARFSQEMEEFRGQQMEPKKVFQLILGRMDPEQILEQPSSFYHLIGSLPLSHRPEYLGEEVGTIYWGNKEHGIPEHGLLGNMPDFFWEIMDNLKKNDPEKYKKAREQLQDFTNYELIKMRIGGMLEMPVISAYRWWDQKPDAFPELMERMTPQERRDFLQSFMREDSRILEEFRPDNPWQLAVLDACEQFIPDDDKYKKFRKKIGQRKIKLRPTEEDIRVERSREYFRQGGQWQVRLKQQWDEGERVYSYLELQPRYVRDDKGIWHVEVYDEETEKWEMRPRWDKYQIVKEIDPHEGIQFARLKNIDGRRAFYYEYHKGDCSFHVIDLETGKEEVRQEQAGFIDDIVEFEDYIITGGADGLLKLWDKKDGSFMREISLGKPIFRLIPLEKNELLAITEKQLDHYNILKIDVEKETMQPIQKITGRQFFLDNKNRLMASGAYLVAATDLQTGEKKEGKVNAAYGASALAADEDNIYAGHKDGIIEIINPDTLDVVRTMQAEYKEGPGSDWSQVLQIIPAPEKKIIVRVRGGGISIFDVPSGRLENKINIDDERNQDIALSADNQIVFTKGEGKLIYIGEKAEEK